MFRRLDATAGSSVRITVDGVEVACRDGDSVAAALLAAGMTACRDTAVSGVARGPFCMMGVCYDCLVGIDGRANRQACMTQVHDGMAVTRQRGAREIQV